MNIRKAEIGIDDNGNFHVANPSGSDWRLLSSLLGENGGSQPVLVASATLTASQIKALDTTPVQLVAAPGAGKVVVPMFPIAYWYVAGATPYTLGMDSDLSLATDDKFETWLSTNMHGWMDQASDQFITDDTASGVLGDAAPGFANKALAIYNRGTPYTLGNGTVTVRVLYFIASS